MCICLKEFYKLTIYPDLFNYLSLLYWLLCNLDIDCGATDVDALLFDAIHIIIITVETNNIPPPAHARIIPQVGKLFD